VAEEGEETYNCCCFSPCCCSCASGGEDVATVAAGKQRRRLTWAPRRPPSPGSTPSVVGEGGGPHEGLQRSGRLVVRRCWAACCLAAARAACSRCSGAPAVGILRRCGSPAVEGTSRPQVTFAVGAQSNVATARTE
jgi:hypothetical protein